MLKFDLGLGQDHDLIGKGHAAYQSIRIVGLNTSKVLHCSCLSLSKAIVEKLLATFHNLK